MELITRAFHLEDPVVDGRTVEGLAVPFGVEQDVADIRPDGQLVRYREQFERGAFRQASRAAHRVTFVYGHSDGFGDRLGHATQLDERDEGLRVTFRLDASRADMAREALTTSHRALSIGFASVVPAPFTEREGQLVVRRHVRLVHVAAVPVGAYAEATVGSIREEAALEADDHARQARQDEAASRAESERLMSEIDQWVASQDEWRSRLTESSGG